MLKNEKREPYQIEVWIALIGLAEALVNLVLAIFTTGEYSVSWKLKYLDARTLKKDRIDLSMLKGPLLKKNRAA